MHSDREKERYVCGVEGGGGVRERKRETEGEKGLEAGWSGKKPQCRCDVAIEVLILIPRTKD